MSEYRFGRRFGEIPTMSNEVELALTGNTAQEIRINNSTQNVGLEIDPEVNTLNILELLISMATTPDELNHRLGENVFLLSQLAQNTGTQLYGGASLYRNTNHLEPARYRTTSLSETLARNLLDMSSHQVIVGIGHHGSVEQSERFGFSLYNTLRALSPLVLALSASSPYRYHQGGLQETNALSKRINQYIQATAYLPHEILTTPKLNSLEEYETILQDISDQVTTLLEQGALDENKEELYKPRENGRAYAPFDRLDPHQLYWLIRPRPDHATGGSATNDSLLSLEMRIADTSLTVQRMQAINSFVLGISYYASKNGFDSLNAVLAPINSTKNFLQTAQQAAKYGLNASLNTHNRNRSSDSNSSKTLRSLLPSLIEMAQAGLTDRGQDTTTMLRELTSIEAHGTHAEAIIEHVQTHDIHNPQELEKALAQVLLQSLAQV